GAGDRCSLRAGEWTPSAPPESRSPRPQEPRGPECAGPIANGAGPARPAPRALSCRPAAPRERRTQRRKPTRCGGRRDARPRMLAQAQYAREAAVSATLAAGAAGMVGARALYVATNLADIQTLGEALALRRGGLSLVGGVAAGCLGSLLAARRARIAWLAWADVAAPALACA